MLIADRADEGEAAAVRSDCLRVLCTNTIMNSMDDKRELARFVFEACANQRSATA